MALKPISELVALVVKVIVVVSSPGLLNQSEGVTSAEQMAKVLVPEEIC